MKSKENNSPLNILVVDLDDHIFKVLQEADLDENIHSFHARSLEEAFASSKTGNYDIVLMNDRLPDGSACDAIAQILESSTHPELLIFSKIGNTHDAELILNSGCWDYVVNAELPKGIGKHLQRMITYRRNKSEASKQKQENLNKDLRSEGIVGTSQILQHCLNLMIKAAQSDANVLISGESGTGKELFAAAIHSVSSRAKRNFVVVDCAALTPTLVESILFGHVKGSFTGADRDKIGLIKKADGGTLLLDEVGELSMEMQKKFLRVLQEQSFRPVGSNIEVRSDFRLIAASNRNLQALCKKGEFREDLLFRIQTFHLELPPLRTRPQDITELAYYFKNQYCGRSKIVKNFSPSFLVLLKQYDWPGNVRELFHALEHSFVISQDSVTVYPVHLPADIRIKVSQNALESTHELRSPADLGMADDLELSQNLQSYRETAIEAAELKYLHRLVVATGGDLKRSLQISGLSRSRFYTLLKKYKISLQGYKHS
jgi:two-component system NtrC family response regulator